MTDIESVNISIWLFRTELTWAPNPALSPFKFPVLIQDAPFRPTQEFTSCPPHFNLSTKLHRKHLLNSPQIGLSLSIPTATFQCHIINSFHVDSFCKIITSVSAGIWEHHP